MNKKQNRIVDAVSGIDEDIIEETGYKRYVLFRAWRQRMKKRNWFIGISSAAASVLLLIVGVALILQNVIGGGDGTQPGVPPVGGPKQIPIYQGMTVSNELPMLETAQMPFASLVLSNSKHVYGNQKVDKEKPFGNSNKPIKDAISDSLEVQGSAEGYFAKPNEDIYITVHVSNPDDFEILSFTLNGVKYSNYMFEKGSDLENLILKVNVGDVEGEISYTIDAIKYVDGTEIKDVRMEGDDTVKITVQPKTLPAASVTGETVAFESLSFSVNITDPKQMVKATEGDKLLAILYNGDAILSQKELNLGQNQVAFEGLVVNTLYQYAVVAIYDAMDGEGRTVHMLYENALYTKAPVLFDGVKLVGDTLSFSLRWDEAVTDRTLLSLSLYMGEEKVEELPLDATSVSDLFQEENYTLVATYRNGEKTETIFVEFSTKTAHAVTLVTNGGEELGTVNLSVGDPLPTPMREGYTFGGWYSDVEQTQKVTSTPNDDITLYAWWKEETRAGKLVYENRPQEGICVTGISDPTLTEVWIPGYIGGLRVEWVEGDFTGITHLTLSSQVRIENHATLQSVTFVKGTGEIELWVANCPNIERVTLSADTHMLGFSFIDCPKLKPAGFHVDSESRYRVVNNCLILGDTLVLGCQDSVIPSDGSVKYIGARAFCGQTDLTSMVIPEGVRAFKSDDFGGVGFKGCSNLFSVTLPETLVEIPAHAFEECFSLTSITIPGGVRRLGSFAFSWSGLQSIVIPDNVKEIGYACFEACNSLTDVSLPDGRAISEDIFFGCPLNYESEGGVLYLGNYAMGCEIYNGSIVIREGTTSIANGIFDTFAGSIQLPSTLAVMPSFSGCRYLKSVVLPEGIESLPNDMFSGCSNLVEVNIPTSVKSIGRNAFKGCTALRTDIEGGISYFGKWAIACDQTVTSVMLRADTVGIATACFEYCTGVTSIDLPEGLRYIDSRAFEMTSLTEITIPASVEYLSGNPFEYCYLLTNVSVESGNLHYHVKDNMLIETATKTLIWATDPRLIPTDGSIVAIRGAFVGMSSFCPEISDLVISDSIVRIECNSFWGAVNLETLTLFNTLEYIGAKAFESCGRLTDIYFNGTVAEWDAIEKGEDWISIYEGCDVTVHCTDGDVVIDAASRYP